MLWVLLLILALVGIVLGITRRPRAAAAFLAAIGCIYYFNEYDKKMLTGDSQWLVIAALGGAVFYASTLDKKWRQRVAAQKNAIAFEIEARRQAALDMRVQQIKEETVRVP